MTDKPEKIDLETPDLAADYRSAVASLLPGVLVDGVIDVTRLSELLEAPVTASVDGRERFGLMWAGKQDAVRSLLSTSHGTLIPEPNQSSDFDNTRNVFIEGDNLEVLKLLQKAYNDKIKLIYIDPPYNTGSALPYLDDFSDTLRTYLRFTGEIDQGGNRTSASPETSGRHHSRWLSMMYPRLVLARNLLTQDGMIFVSIDDNEVHNLRSILDEIFGEHNFVATFKWNKTSKAPTLSKLIRNKYEYVLAYTRGQTERLRGVDSYNTAAPLLNSGNARSEVRFAEGELGCLFADGTYPAGLYGTPEKGVELLDALVVAEQKNVDPIRVRGRFKWSQSTVENRLQDGVEIFIKTPKMSTIYYSLSSGPDKFIAPADIINPEEVQVKRNDDAYTALKDLFDGRIVFDYSKPVSLIKYLVRMIPEDDFVVLDFFAGSGTTAHAVMELNAEDGGQRRNIQVQLPEPIADDAGLESLGFSSIAAIARRRTELAGKKILAASPTSLSDVGFRAYRLGRSNFVRAEEIAEGELFAMNEKTVRAETVDRYAIAAEVFLMEGVTLDAPWIEHELEGATAQLSGGVAVVSGQKLTNDVVQQVFDLAPRIAVFLEDELAGKDALKANAFTNARNRGITMKTV